MSLSLSPCVCLSHSLSISLPHLLTYSHYRPGAGAAYEVARWSRIPECVKFAQATVADIVAGTGVVWSTLIYSAMRGEAVVGFMLAFNS